jgi:hypothetical protein
MNLFYKCIVFYFVCLSGWAQDIVLKGIVLDSKTKVCLPDVSLIINNVGVSTNAEGKFFFKIPIEWNNQELTATLMGYKTYTIKISQISTLQNIQILLEESQELLAEVTLKALTASQIVALAYEKIPENYPLTSTLYTGFYRESNYHYQNQEKDAQCFYMIEAVIKHNKPSYKHRLPEGDIKIVEARKNKFVDDEHKFTKWYAGAFTPIRFDVAKQRFEFMEPKHLDKYEYEITGFTSYQNRQIQKISFKPIKPSAEYEGVIYIDTETFAIAKVDYKLTKRGLHFDNLLGKGSTIVERAFRVNYQTIKDKWYLQSIWQQAKAEDYTAKDTVKYTTEYAVTRIDTNTREKFEYIDKLQFEDILLRKETPYQADFWKSYNVVVPTENEEKLLINTQIQTKEIVEITSKKNKFHSDTKRFGSLRACLGFGQGFIQNEASLLQINYANPANSLFLDESINLRPNELAHSVEAGYELYLIKGLYLSFKTSTRIGNFSYLSVQLGLSSEWRISKPSKRPLKLMLGAHYGTLRFRKKIHDLDNPQNMRLQINETTFESSRVRINLGKDYEGLNLSLGFGYEINRRNFLAFNVGYFMANVKTEAVYVREKGFHFFTKPRETTLALQDTYLKIRTDGNETKRIPFKVNVFTSLSYKFSFGK